MGEATAKEAATAKTPNAALGKVAGAARAAGEEAPAETPNATKAPAEKPANCGLNLLASIAAAASVKHRTNYKKGRAKVMMDEAVEWWRTSDSGLHTIAGNNKVDSTSLWRRTSKFRRTRSSGIFSSAGPRLGQILRRKLLSVARAPPTTLFYL